MATLINYAGKNTLADGTALTTSNTTGGGNTNFATVSGSPVKRLNYALAQPGDDSAWYEIPALTGTSSYVSINAGTVPTQGAIGAWCWLASLPTASHQFFRVGASGSNVLSISAAGAVILTANGTNVYTSATGLVPTGVPFWLSHTLTVSATVGQLAFGLWSARGALLGSTATAASYNTSGVTSGYTYFGKMSTTGNTGIMRFAGLRATLDNATLIPPPPSRHRGWGLAA